MDFNALIENYKNIITKKYADFNGRAGRKEFWYFVLCNFIVGIVLGILTNVPGIGGIFGFVSGIYSLAVLVPGIALAVRRLHDLGKAGVQLLFVLIPLAGPIILIVWYVKEGEPGDNAYGPRTE